MLNGLSFPSKIILFGEYTAIERAPVLAMPWNRFNGQWTYDWNETYASGLLEFVDYLSVHTSAFIDHERLRTAVQKGLKFESNIPQGYGLGSSGALVAAVFKNFQLTDIPTWNMSTLQSNLGLMESFFHSSSSGVDPLIAFLKQTIRLEQGQAEEVQIPNSILSKIKLLDSGIKRDAGPLIAGYKAKRTNSDFLKLLNLDLIPAVEDIIEAALAGDSESFQKSFISISHAQWEGFQAMIPESIKPIWKKGLDSGDYALKICGAGGGGYFMGIDRSGNGLERIGLPLEHL